jgi:hypothetical protein
MCDPFTEEAMKVLKLGAVASLALLLAACPERDGNGAAGDRAAVPAEEPTAATPEAETANLDEFAGSGVTGEVHVTPRGSQTDVMVLVRDARPNSSVPVTLHTGTCDAPGPRIEEIGTLTTNQTGQGHIQTSLAMAPHQVMNGMHVVAIHEEGREAASPIACARIPEHHDGPGAPGS